MLIQETKMDQQQLQEIVKKMKPMYEVMAQDANGTEGGIVVLWNPEEVIFENWINLPRILSGMFRLTGMEERIIIFGVYGPHSPRDRKDFLNNVQTIRKVMLGNLWITGGDFNLIRVLGEKRGGIRRGGRNQISSRLDRFLLSEQILNCDVFIETKILLGLGSDHWPIRLEIDIKKNKGKKPFRFETFWLRHPEFIHKMEEWWTQSIIEGKGKMHTFQLKLKEIKSKIRKWNKEEFRHIMEEKQKLDQEMEDIQLQIIWTGRDEE
eukprot:PITA_20494